MNIAEVFDDYVGDVLRHLPASLRQDVGYELRLSLDDALAERAAAANAAADYAMALAVLQDFGAPQVLAARYQPESPALISGAEVRPFLRLALGGVMLQWLLTLPSAVSQGRLGAWWLSSGLGALWWPGALVLGAASRRWWRLRRAATGHDVSSRVDRARVRRRLSQLGLGLAATGSLVVLLMPLWSRWLTPVGAQAFALAPEFAQGRGLLAIPMWLATIGLRLVAARSGRWTARLRQWRVITDVTVTALLLWWSLGPAIFVVATTDTVAKGLLQMVSLFIAVDLVARWMQRGRTITAPARGE